MGWASLRGFCNDSDRGSTRLFGSGVALLGRGAAPAWRPGLEQFKREKRQLVPSSALRGGAARVRPAPAALLSLTGEARLRSACLKGRPSLG